MSTKMNAERREKLGTRHARALRESGMIPAVLQANEKKSHLDISISEDEFLATRRKHEHLYDIEVDGALETALVQNLAWDVYGERIVHIEFRRVDRDVKTEVEVALDFVGHPKGVLNHLLTHVRVRALPTEIPDSLEVSVADLEAGTNVFASALKMPQGVELVTSPEAIVARISQIKIEVEAAPAPVEGAAIAAATPEGGEAAEKAEKPEKAAKPEKGEKKDKKGD